ncbi:VirB4 family type IV secretion system protein [Deinococcus ruber]|nr:TraC family protein [Deinococcus ruber]
MAIRRGMVLMRDGSVEFGIRNYPLSAARVSATNRSSIRERLRRAIIGTLPVGTRIRHYTISTTASEEALAPFLYDAETDNPVLKSLHEERQNTLRQLAHTGQLSDLQSFFTFRVPMPSRPKNADYYSSELQALMPNLLRLRRELAEQMMSSGMYCQAMNTQEVFAPIFRYFNPGLSLAGVPEYSSTLDTLALEHLDDASIQKNTLREQLACSALDHSNDGYLLLDNVYLTTVSMNKAGGSTTPGLTETVTRRLAGKNYVLLNEFVVSDSSTTRQKINEQLDSMEYEQVALNAGRETGRRIQIGEAILDNIEAGEVLGDWSSSVLLYAASETELQRMRVDAVTAYREMKGIRPVVGDAQNLDLFLDSAPFSGAEHPYHTKGYSKNFMDFVPIVGPWEGNPDPILTFRNPYGGLTGINPSSSSVNYGMVVAGEAGSGKTHLMQVLLSACAALGARSTCIDMKDGYIAAYESLQGAILEIAPGARLRNGEYVCINMFDLPKKDAQPTPDKMARILSIMAILDINTSALRRNILQNALQTLYLRHSEPIPDAERALYLPEDELGQPIPGAELPTYRYTGQARLRDLVNAVRNLNQLGSEGITDQSVKDELRLMARELEAYTAANNPGMGHFLDGFTTVELDNPHTYLRAKRMEEDSVMLRVGLLLMSDLVWKNGLDYPHDVKLNINEEVGVLAQIDGAMQLIRKQYKLGREYNFWPVAVSQEADDIAAIRGVTNNVSTVIIGSMKPEQARLAVQAFNLPGSVEELMDGLGGKPRLYREYVVVSFTSEGVIEGTRAALYTNELEMAMFSSKAEDKAKRERIQAEYGSSVSEAALILANKEMYAHD